MIRIQHTVVVNRPVGEVFAYLTDLGNLPEWQPQVVEVDKRPGEPAAVGERVNEVRNVLGRRIESTLEVIESERDRTFMLEMVSGSLWARLRHAFEEVDGGTSITFVGEGEAGGLLKLAEPMIARNASREAEEALETLREILEAVPRGAGA